MAEGGIEGYQLQEKLGEGSFGKVYKALEIKTGRAVAVKVVPVEQDTGEVAREIEMLKACASDNIVRYYSSFTRGSELWIVMEFCAGSSLCDVMEARSRCLTERQIGAVLAETLAGLSYLHSLNKIHRDIKAGNLLLTEDGTVKLADFGVSAQLNTSISRRGTVIGTPFWMAPEVISSPGPEAGYNSKADVWSLGITAIELAEGSPPNSNLHPMRAIFLIPTQPPPQLAEPEKWSAAFRDFVGRCLTKEVEKRPTATELLQHAFIREGRKAVSGAVLKQLMESASEALAAWRKQALEASGSLEEDEPGTLKRGDTQEFDMDAIRKVAGRLGGSGTVDASAAYGTMVVKESAEAAGGGGDAGTMIFRHPSPSSSSSGTVVLNSAAPAPASVPGFMRQFQSAIGMGGGAAAGSAAGGGGGGAGRGGAAGSVPASPSGDGAGDLGGGANGRAAKEAASKKYDFSHLSLAGIDEELSALGANLERDMAKLRRQYEKRERALRQAKSDKGGR
ncbi:putative Serine/threonine-protein kinase [Emiliania huxleyi CCMP1516]|uniref:non-specific serine/threonine protein kinase n=2 Tax=Emiliania huxleyi TaxID=2903 RepID=A0A0D3J1V2_EMIH1|nr:putative Serine/threonine-protein kinase [Emiliania huxleyi CCMP1516]EOD17487.1 putative Serine/threonine-protein kinase [Emiliania huxleyi CCMP1516]|eukprot:XP_005769916.1 putative Serine/threonine-protein kinase [Emiliania huxleyi CCMP1516]